MHTLLTISTKAYFLLKLQGRPWYQRLAWGWGIRTVVLTSTYLVLTVYHSQHVLRTLHGVSRWILKGIYEIDTVTIFDRWGNRGKQRIVDELKFLSAEIAGATLVYSRRGSSQGISHVDFVFSQGILPGQSCCPLPCWLSFFCSVTPPSECEIINCPNLLNLLTLSSCLLEIIS